MAPPAQQFRGPVHCADLTDDGLVYVCDRPGGSAIQVFQKDGTFVEEMFIEKNTPGAPELSMGRGLLSTDPDQTFIYIPDGTNEKIHVVRREGIAVHLQLRRRRALRPATFYGVHSIDTDSDGNIYTTETYEG